MTWLAGPLGRWLVVLLLMAGSAGAAAIKMHEHDQIEYEALVAETAAFKGGVDALGRAAQKAAVEKAREDVKNKERTDAEQIRRNVADGVSIARLRADAAARDSRGGSLPTSPLDSGCPEKHTCFNTAEYQRALGAFDAGARRLVDEGAEVALALKLAREWAAK